MAGEKTARQIDVGNTPRKLGGSEEGVGVVGAFSGRRVPSALQRLHSCVSLVVVCVSKKPKTFSSEMKYVTQMAELETGQRAMLKAILLRSHRKVSFRYQALAPSRPWFSYVCRFCFLALASYLCGRVFF